MNNYNFNITKELRSFLGLLYMFDWKYIARDEDGELYIYKCCPIKGEGHWLPFNKNVNRFKMIDLYYLSSLININKVFEFIKWEDEEPFCIEDYID